MISLLLIINIAVASPVSAIERTSKFTGKYCILSEANKKDGQLMYLGMQERGKLRKIIRFPYSRFEREGLDKVFISGDRIIALLTSSAGRYFHFFVRRFSDRYRLLRVPNCFGRAGGDDVVELDGYLIGTVWVTPDDSPTPGNYLYVFSPASLKVGRLPGLEAGYDVSAIGRNIVLERWSVHGGLIRRSRHAWPIAMKRGAWDLTFPGQLLVPTALYRSVDVPDEYREEGRRARTFRGRVADLADSLHISGAHAECRIA
ncbi:MAG: hypothetical protein ACR2HJ_09250 [Fimbriimonadales bacterium]